jgi:EAL domain-containing protein (putative c-di-GMP-specific phosphodiesterase class I)
MLDEHHIPPELVTLELTEATLTQVAASSRDILSALKERGITIALDNFGAGQSSLHHLRYLPLDMLKIDMSLIAELNLGPAQQAITASVIGLGRALGLKVLAEGVETSSQRSVLTTFACDRMQGHLHSRPMLADEIAPLFGATRD